MDSNENAQETLLEQGIRALQTLLGEGWTVRKIQPGGHGVTDAAVFDARVEVLPPDQGRFTELLVSARQKVTPLIVQRNIAPVRNVLAYTHSPPTLLVVAPWISARAQEELRARGIGYLDLTGNASLSVLVPSIRILTHGATRSPKGYDAADGKAVTLAGPRAGRIVRFLVDYEPPYQALQIADANKVSLPWVSRLLRQLEDQLLITRVGRSIRKVDWKGLLQARADSYDLVRHNPTVGTIAANGVQSVLQALARLAERADGTPDVAVTGPYAARAAAPLTAGGQLMLYIPHEPHSVDIWADQLGLLRVDEGADVLLLRAHDQVVFERRRWIDGIPHVALSQLVLDGLAGPGRMPAEAEAVLRHMDATVDDWRRSWDGQPGV